MDKYIVNKKLKVSKNERERVICPNRTKGKTLYVEIDTFYRSFLGCSPYGGKGIHLFAFTLRPKGKKKSFRDYIPYFKEQIYKTKMVLWVYYTRERTNTKHLHGVIAIRDFKYKFKKFNTDYYSILAKEIKDLKGWCTYMCKEGPKSYYFIRQISMYRKITYDHKGKVNPSDLLTKQIDLKKCFSV